jgi:hypothetical protein
MSGYVDEGADDDDRDNEGDDEQDDDDDVRDAEPWEL